MSSILSKYDSIENLKFEDDGHYHLLVPVFHDFNSYSNDSVDFVFDTGAFLSVLTQDTAIRLGFENRFIVQKDIELSGFAGGCLADLKEIPGYFIIYRNKIILAVFIRKSF